MPAEFSVRRLTAGDLPDYRAMNGLFADAFEMPDEYLGAVPSDAYCRDWLTAPQNIAVIAESNRQIVGALAGYELAKFEQPRREIYIYDLAVAQSHRRRGIATAMIGEVRSVAHSRGAWIIIIEADPEDIAPNALYSKLGKCQDAKHYTIRP